MLSNKRDHSRMGGGIELYRLPTTYRSRVGIRSEVSSVEGIRWVGQRRRGCLVQRELGGYDARGEDKDSERKRAVRPKRERVGVGLGLVSVRL